MFLLSGLIFNVILLTTGSSADGQGEISRRMCKKYSEYADSLNCSIYTSNSDVTLGGTFATRQQFPHVVLLGHGVNDKIQWDCAGSLISEQHVLTAAHCLTSHYGPPEIVKLGVTNLEDKDHLQQIKIKEIKVYPLYTSSAMYNDIGLVKLEKKIDVNEYARPACLNTLTQIENLRVIYSGWAPNKQFSGTLEEKMQTFVPVLHTQEKCNNFFNTTVSSKILKNGITYDTMVCAGGDANQIVEVRSTGTLQTYHKADGGKNSCMYDIVGVSSFGKAIVQKDQSTVFTRVSAFLPWIEENVWSNE